MRIEIILMKPNQFGKVSEVGKHLKPDTAAEILRAIEDCSVAGFETLFIYARQPSKAVNDFIKQARQKLAIQFIPGGLSGRGGYLIESKE